MDNEDTPRLDTLSLLAEAQAECDRLQRMRLRLVGALGPAYGVLAHPANQWAGRDTLPGQSLLCGMRDALAEALAMDPQHVQDELASLWTVDPRADASAAARTAAECARDARRPDGSR